MALTSAIVRSGAAGLRSVAKQTRLQGVWVGVDPRRSSGGDARHARLDERGAWLTRSVLSRFSAKKQFERPWPPRGKLYSPGSSQGLDARRLVILYAATVQGSEQVGEFSIPGYILRRFSIYQVHVHISGSFYSPSDSQWIFVGF